MGTYNKSNDAITKSDCHRSTMPYYRAVIPSPTVITTPTPASAMICSTCYCYSVAFSHISSLI